MDLSSQFVDSAQKWIQSREALESARENFPPSITTDAYGNPLSPHVMANGGLGVLYLARTIAFGVNLVYRKVQENTHRRIFETRVHQALGGAAFEDDGLTLERVAEVATQPLEMPDREMLT